MSIREAGRRGGLTTAKTRGREHYVKMAHASHTKLAKLLDIARTIERGEVK
jgi:hypothetical protein